MNPDRLAELEEERRFLLRSIRDLEQEHAVGDVDEHDFATLRDGYVARAAVVLREIDSGRQALPVATQRPWWRRLVVPAATIAVGVLLGVAVASYAGQRAPGQTLTGGQGIDRVTAALSIARQELGSNPKDAISQYRTVLATDPGNVEAHTYLGWLLVVNSGGNGDAVQAGLAELAKAISLDDGYPDAHCLLAVGNAKFVSPPDVATAKAEGKRCLDAGPPAQMVQMVQAMLDSL
jgi:cytochrome c-type biogenesis protein CcmH/NrfG